MSLAGVDGILIYPVCYIRAMQILCKRELRIVSTRNMRSASIHVIYTVNLQHLT